MAVIRGKNTRTLVQSRVCFSAQIFTSGRAYRHRALARRPSEGTPHHTNDLAGSLGLSCVRGARRELTEEGQHQRPRCSVRITIMLWTGRPCRRGQCWLWRKGKGATGPASAPKLRQNRIKCSSLRFKCNSLLYLNRGLPRECVYDLSAVRHEHLTTTSFERYFLFGVLS